MEIIIEGPLLYVQLMQPNSLLCPMLISLSINVNKHLVPSCLVAVSSEAHMG